jgi:hypothetical protein
MSDRLTVLAIGDMHLKDDGAPVPPAPDTSGADMVLLLGDWVDSGTDAQYVRALRWTDQLGRPCFIIRGNHDNGRWRRFARQAAPDSVVRQWDGLGAEDDYGTVLWRPYIWERIHEPITNFARLDGRHAFPVPVQNHIIKQRDMTPSYYTHDAGDGTRMIFLDTSDWLLRDEQLAWLTQQVAQTTQPVVIVAHHHVLPVGTHVDNAQLHERDALRRLLIENRHITTYLHAHAHHPQWWKYGHVDVVGAGYRSYLQMTFEAGRLVQLMRDGQADAPRSFHPQYMMAQCPKPGAATIVFDPSSPDRWGQSSTTCLGWLDARKGSMVIQWSMRLPVDLSPADHEAIIRLRTSGRSRLIASGAGLADVTEQSLAPMPDGATVHVPIGPLVAGYTQVQLRCTEGWGYVQEAAELCPARV